MAASHRKDGHMQIKPVTVGIVGAGAISDIYLTNMTTRFPILRVKSICAGHIENARKKADKFGILACTLEEMLSDPEIELIVNLTPAHAHYDIIRQALSAGKHVYTEKTITDSPDTAADLTVLAREKGLYLASAPDTFLGSAWQTARKAIDDGLIGHPTSFAMAANRDATFMDSLNAFRNQPGGGACYNYVVYYISCLVSLLGPVSQVFSVCHAPIPQRTNIFPGSPHFGKEIKTPNESQVYSILSLRSGVCGTFHLNEESVLMDQAFFAIYGTEGILYLTDPNGFGGEIKYLPNSYDFKNPPALQTLPNHFDYSDNSRGVGPADVAMAIRTGSAIRPNAQIAAHVMEVLTAMMRNGVFTNILSDCERPEPMPMKNV